MLPALAELTLRGSAAFVIIWSLDRILGRRMQSRSRRAWWWLVASAFLLPLQIIPSPSLPDAMENAFPLPAGLVPDLDFAAADNNLASPQSGLAMLLFWLWLAGFAGSLSIVAVRTIRTHRRWSRERLCTDPALLNVLEDCKAAASISAPIGLVLSDSLSTPALLGWLRPRILLPTTLVSDLPPERLRAVLLHELAHFRALDLGLHWLFSLACAIHWFNPLAHLAARAWLRFRELAADEDALARFSPEQRSDYGETLLATLRHAHVFPTPHGALALGESLENLKHRILMLSRHSFLARWAALALAVNLTAGGFLVLQSVRAEETPPESSADNTKAAATEAMIAWLKLADAGDYEESWKQAAEDFRNQVTIEQWKQAMRQVRAPLGACQQRRRASASFQTALPPKLRGEFVIAQFNSAFENLSAAVETVTFVKQPDGQWRALGYFIKPQ